MLVVRVIVETFSQTLPVTPVHAPRVTAQNILDFLSRDEFGKFIHGSILYSTGAIYSQKVM